MRALERVRIHRLDNGITLLGEEMDDVASGAFSILVPLGAATDPEGFEGSAAVLSEMFHKGAGPFDSRQLSAEFENMGAQRSHSAGTEVSFFSGAVLGENLGAVLKLYSTVLLEPRLPEDELESVKQLALQEIRSLEDEPSNKVMVELAQRFYPYPWGRSQLGTLSGVQALTPQSLRDHYRQAFVADRALIAVAGKFDWEAVKDQVTQYFGGWKGSTPPVPQGELSAKSSVHHLQRDTSQLQIALAYPSVSVDHPDNYTAKVATGVLSGGMSGRLFIEVREKRGLVYRVSASYSAALGRAGIFVYAGTTPENSEETLSVIIEELRKLGAGVTEEELQRSKADLKSKIVMALESSSGRASAMVNDYWNLKRVRSVDEIKSGIDRVTDDDIRRHLAERPAAPITLVTLGSKSLELPA